MYVELYLPLPSENVFRYKAMDQILENLAQNPNQEFTNRQLREITEYKGPSVTKSLQLLENLRLIKKKSEGNKNLYRINSEILHEPEDPILSIPQNEFRKPIDRLREKLKSRIEHLKGIVIFGSVARGEADRSSDIDCLVIVDEDVVKARRAVTEIVKDIQNQRFDGNRYEFETLVESIESAKQRKDQLKTIFGDGITIHRSDGLREVKNAVLLDGNKNANRSEGDKNGR